MSAHKNIESFGETIRRLRKERRLPLRAVATGLGIDQAVLSKIERGQRRATRDQVNALADFFEVNRKDLATLWLTDKLVYDLAEEDLGPEVLQLAAEKMAVYVQSKGSLAGLTSDIVKVLRKDGRVAKAWIYGSTATLQAKPESDVDIIVELNDAKKYSMFDLLDIAHIIEQKINRKVDLAEKGQLKDFAFKTARHQLQKIYG